MLQDFIIKGLKEKEVPKVSNFEEKEQQSGVVCKAAMLLVGHSVYCRHKM